MIVYLWDGRLYNCCICGTPNAQIHEVFFGRGVRDLAIEYNLQVPLCVEHHNNGKDCAHNNKLFYQNMFCGLFGINRNACFRALDSHKHSKVSRRYLCNVKWHLRNFLNNYLTN